MFARILIVAFIATVLTWSALTRASEGAGSTRNHVVEPTETLWSIAVEEYGGDPRAAVWRIQKANKLGDTLLRPGQQLVLP